jgi:hypothetical protein
VVLAAHPGRARFAGIIGAGLCRAGRRAAASGQVRRPAGLFGPVRRGALALAVLAPRGEIIVKTVLPFAMIVLIVAIQFLDLPVAPIEIVRVVMTPAA